MKKREETASRTTTPPFNTHVGPASSETSWRTKSPELCKGCNAPQEVLMGNGCRGKRSKCSFTHSLPCTQHLLTPSGGKSQPQQSPAFLCALCTDSLPCPEGAEATKPLTTPQGCFSLNCRLLGSPCVLNNITAFRGSLPCFPKQAAQLPKVPHVSWRSRCLCCLMISAHKSNQHFS